MLNTYLNFKRFQTNKNQLSRTIFSEFSETTQTRGIMNFILVIVPSFIFPSVLAVSPTMFIEMHYFTLLNDFFDLSYFFFIRSHFICFVLDMLQRGIIPLALIKNKLSLSC